MSELWSLFRYFCKNLRLRLYFWRYYYLEGVPYIGPPYHFHPPPHPGTLALALVLRAMPASANDSGKGKGKGKPRDDEGEGSAARHAGGTTPRFGRHPESTRRGGKAGALIDSAVSSLGGNDFLAELPRKKTVCIFAATVAVLAVCRGLLLPVSLLRALGQAWWILIFRWPRLLYY